MNSQYLDKLFAQYGYEIKTCSDSHRVYLSHQGMYHGAEIVVLDNRFDYSKLQASYSSLGYACKVHTFNTYDEAENYLFSGFFGTQFTSARIRQRYNEFADGQVRHFGNSNVKYEYIRVPYITFSDNTRTRKENIIADINDVLRKKGAYLMIVEAAAGFGKTCTAFELYKSLEDSTGMTQPLFTELSRNRDAKRFKYVLWSEIDAEYSSNVKKDLVIYNIRKGRIPLIIDGFDELLTKNIDEGVGGITQFEEVETMLSTIGDLLTDNAKVILTSRKTAIFSGEQFSDWVNNYNNSFEVIRYQLEKPEIKHWLSQEREELLRNNNVPLSSISNPVLLTYLRNVSNEEFEKLAATPDTIVDKYFEYLLSRERIRQNLVIPVKDQMLIYQNLAKSFAVFDISCDERSFVKELITDYNRTTLQFYRELSDPKPTMEELADTLTNHALLDRIGIKDYIGFINDFVFGVLLGKAILKDGADFLKKEEIVPIDLLEKMVFAFKYANSEMRHSLWDKILSLRDMMPRGFLLLSDTCLLNRVKISIENESVNSNDFDGITFDADDSHFSETTFTGTAFSNCIFDKNAFNSCYFIGCTFINCKLLDKEQHSSSVIYCFGCEDYGNGFVKSFVTDKENRSVISASLDYEILILRQYFKVDGKSTRMKFISAIKASFDEVAAEEAFSVFHKLKKAGYIQVDGNNSYITQEGINYFRKLS